MTLEPKRGDNTKRIQDALNRLGTLPMDANGSRGALLLKRGTYLIAGSLNIGHSGVVLRGEGNGPDGTIIVATGYGDIKHQRTLITVGPDSENLPVNLTHGFPENLDRFGLVADSKQEVVDEYVPVGAHTFRVASTAGYKPGDRIVVYRPSTAEWIHSIGCDRLPPNWVDNPVNPRWAKDGDMPGLYYQRPDGYSTYYRAMKPDESWEQF